MSLCYSFDVFRIPRGWRGFVVMAVGRVLTIFSLHMDFEALCRYMYLP